jgi:hypothetical protein
MATVSTVPKSLQGPFEDCHQRLFARRLLRRQQPYQLLGRVAGGRLQVAKRRDRHRSSLSASLALCHAAPGTFPGLRGGRRRAQCLGMMTFTELPSIPSNRLVPFTDQLRLAVAAYLARFKGSSRGHSKSDLRCFLAWCAQHGLDPLPALEHCSLPVWMPAWICGTSRSPPVTPTRAPQCVTTEHGRTSTATQTTSWPPTWPPAPNSACVSYGSDRRRRPPVPMSGSCTGLALGSHG